MKSKTCRICGESHDLSFFYKDSRSKDGHRSDCKNCSKRIRRKHYQENIEYYRDSNKRWRQGNQQYYLECKKRYRQENSDKCREYNKRWRQENREHRREYQKKYYQDNKGDILQYKERWVKDNPEKVKIYQASSNAKRRAAKKFKVSAKDLLKIKEKPCAWCGERLNIHADHVIPIAKGGVHGVGNLQPLCDSCNYSKGAKYMIEFKRDKQQYA